MKRSNLAFEITLILIFFLINVRLVVPLEGIVATRDTEIDPIPLSRNELVLLKFVLLLVLFVVSLPVLALHGIYLKFIKLKN